MLLVWDCLFAKSEVKQHQHCQYDCFESVRLNPGSTCNESSSMKYLPLINQFINCCLLCSCGFELLSVLLARKFSTHSITLWICHINSGTFIKIIRLFYTDHYTGIHISLNHIVMELQSSSQLFIPAIVLCDVVLWSDLNVSHS